MTDFVITVAQQQAHKIIQEHNTIELSFQDSLRFVELLLNPPEPSTQMRQEYQAYQQLVITE